ncbi:MAG: hypothetical protein ACP5H5_00280 [Pyrobaculum sp.]
MKWWLAAFLVAAAMASAQFVSWYPPGAVIINAYPINTTTFSEYYNDAVYYYVQEGLAFRGSEKEGDAIMSYLYQACKYVAVEPLNATSIENNKVYVRANIYCSSDGRSWLPLKWLSLRFAAYVSYVEIVNATGNFTTPVGNFSGVAPAGWYLHVSTRTVVKVPPTNTSLYVEYDRLAKTLDEIRTELGRALVNNTALGGLVRQLSEKVKALSDEKAKLEELLRQREQVINALNAKIQAQSDEIDNLKKKLDEALARNNALLKRMEELNKTHSTQVSQLQSQLAQLQSQLSAAKEEGSGGAGWLIPVLFIALAGIAGAFVYIRKRQSE